MKKWYCVLTRRPICSLVLVGLLPFPLDRATRLAWSMATNEQALCICLPLLILARERSTLERRCASGRKSSLPCSSFQLVDQICVQSHGQVPSSTHLSPSRMISASFFCSCVFSSVVICFSCSE